MKNKNKPTVVDLFAGAGLFSHAFAEEGFSVIRAVEWDKVAAATYVANMGDHMECADITTIKPKGSCDVLIGGPPCQGFSTLGKRMENDPRNKMSLEVVKWAKIMKPKVIVIENVAVFLNTPIWELVAAQLREEGYDVTALALNAYDAGAPQMRQRSFTIASKIGRPKIGKPTMPLVRTVREAWAGLSKIPDGNNFHIATKPSPLALARMQVIPLKGDRRDVMQMAPHLVPKSWHGIKGQATDVWSRLSWDKPSNTLRTSLLNPSKGKYIHPEQNRVITLREAARLHSIPDSWTFVGTPTQIARQIGNSVPPALGRLVAKSVKTLFN